MFSLEYELNDGTIIQTPKNNTDGIELLVPSILDLKKSNENYVMKDDNQVITVKAADIVSVKVVF